MTWTYTEDPLNVPLDAIRFEIGDTDVGDQLLKDAEILYVMNEEVSVIKTAIRCCENIIAKLSRDVDKKIGPTDIKASQKVEHYEKLMQKLKSRIFVKAFIYCGSLSVAEEVSDFKNTDLKKPAFGRDMMTNK